jgi:hypothetical protein
MDFNSQPLWAGAVLLFPDRNIYAFQVRRPAARIQLEQKFQRLGVWQMGGGIIPVESTIEINLKGDALDWDPDGSGGERMVWDVLGGDIDVLPGAARRALPSS